MTIRLSAVAACLAVLAAPTMASAQTQSPPDVTEEVSEALAQMNERLRPLASAIGVDFGDMIDRIDPLIRASVPATPDSEGSWGFDMAFSNATSVTGDSSATDGRQPVFNDAQACIDAYPAGGPVVYFRRIAAGGLRGHQCVMAGYEADMGVLISETYAEGADRHLTASYKAGAKIDGDPAAVRLAVEPVVDANIALATALADLAIEAALKAQSDTAD